jgi:tetratricopeptide (TPR) repeat protein
MYNYDELEKIYYKRKIKKFFFSFSFLFILSIVFYLLFIYFKQSKNRNHTINTTKVEINSSKKNSVNLIKPEINLSKKSIVNVTKLEKNISKTNNVDLKKSEVNILKKTKKEVNHSINKIDKLMLNPIIPDVNITSISTSNKNKSSIESMNKLVKKQVKQKINNSQKLEVEPKPTILIKVSKEKSSLKNLLNNYKLFPEYATAIKIATIYFNKKMYNNCIEWAKKANNINAEDEESWLLYAKSLVKLGKIKEAKKLLDSYLQIYGQNRKVKQYLRSIK